MRWGTAMVTAVTLIVAVPAASTAQSAISADRTLVMPFENVKRESSIVWLGEASAVLLTDNLNALGHAAITRPERLQALDRLQVPTAAVLTDATVIRIGELVGAAQVIVGSLEVDDSTLVVHARSIALEAGRLQAEVTERGAMTDLFAIFDRLAQQLASPSLGAATVESDRPPAAAFENYIKGLLAETPSTATNFLNAALKLYPGYDRARLALWDVYTDEGDSERALAVVQAVSSTSSSASRARFLAGLSQLTLRKYDEAFTTFKALVDAQPTPTALNNLGVVQLRRGGTPQTGLATYYFDKAASADPDDPDYVFNLGYAYWSARDTQAAVYWLREAVRRSPADGHAHFVLGAALAAGGNAAEASREKELARRLSSVYLEWEKRPLADQVPKGLERVKNEAELPHALRLEARLAATGQRDQQALAAFYLDRARRQYQQANDRAAAAELARALYLSPYLAEGHLLLARIHLRNGRVSDAIDALKISLWSAETAEAHAVLGTAYFRAGDLEAARTEGLRALELDPSSSDAKSLLDMLKSP